jgi:hypothetical protein
MVMMMMMIQHRVVVIVVSSIDSVMLKPSTLPPVVQHSCTWMTESPSDVIGMVDEA